MPIGYCNRLGASSNKKAAADRIAAAGWLARVPQAAPLALRRRIGTVLLLLKRV